jgi:hypothetical protein
MVAKASGDAITSGTVNYYLKAKNGVNAGKWWKNSDQTWAAVETANAMTHDADGNWTIELAASPFADGIVYLEYAKESGDLHVAGEGRLLRGKAVDYGLASADTGATAVARTGADSDTLETLSDQLDTILEDTGTTLPAQIAALDISAGTGTYACTWTVDDGSTALEGAKVSFWLAGVLRGTGTTDASGEVSMSLDAGTYTVAISLSGYTFASTTHAVSATASTWTKTFSMTAIVFSPTPDADQVTAWGYVYGPAGTVESGATIVLEQRTAGARQIYDNAPRTLTADGSGLVSAVVWADGSEYRYRRGTGGEWSELFAPEDDEDPDLPNSYRLPGWLGAS